MRSVFRLKNLLEAFKIDFIIARSLDRAVTFRKTTSRRMALSRMTLGIMKLSRTILNRIVLLVLWCPEE
jgi:hypothetical protein